MRVEAVTWDGFLSALKEAGGSTDMQTSKTGRYPWLFHFCRGQADQLAEVVIWAQVKGGTIQSPPRDWRTRERILSDYRSLADHGGKFNDTQEAIAAEGSTP